MCGEHFQQYSTRTLSHAYNKEVCLHVAPVCSIVSFLEQGTECRIVTFISQFSLKLYTKF